ncbi:hypothetical protein [Pseudomonas frederiksbergensis]|uniref:Uncharacterized protein n=1 Tax=Pseudomonas frederiksbergensis TaxID=104087 RepID=A0A6L5BX59_9PSED|nr:hypothetical protein [Pseudomonas frederiksbergensis]KAF2393159.1 hypothetical protein FX983_01120 [Pseudomonas frederiksbergensis]
MLLAKSCAKQFNVKNGTLMLGTLNEYRETEDEQIGDKREGKIQFNLRFDGDVTISKQWFNTLQPGGWQIGDVKPINLPGYTAAHFHHVRTVGIDEHTVTLRDSSATIWREALNCFIFCMSEVKKTYECIDIFPTYDDYWYVNSLNAQHFGEMIGRTLFDKIQSGRASGNHIIPANVDITNLKIHMRHELVKYTDRDILITSETAYTLDALINQLRDMAFVKPTLFKKEKEYRFHYTILSNNKIIEPLVNRLVINSEHLVRHVFSV